jgi:hypothetical protein
VADVVNMAMSVCEPHMSGEVNTLGYYETAS